MSRIEHKKVSKNNNYVKILAINKTGSLFQVDYFILESMINNNFKSMTFTKTEQNTMVETYYELENQL